MLVALNNVHDIFAEIADLMVAKFRDMSEAWKASKEWCEVTEQIRRGEMRDDEVLEAEAKFREKANKWRAFNTTDDQTGMIKAADYHDTWFRTEVAAFNVYYICRAGHEEWPCRTVKLSNWWNTKHADPLATKQKWYCPACQAGYKTKWGGVIVEMVVNRVAFDIPPAGEDDDNIEIAKDVCIQALDNMEMPRPPPARRPAMPMLTVTTAAMPSYVREEGGVRDAVQSTKWQPQQRSPLLYIWPAGGQGHEQQHGFVYINGGGKCINWPERMKTCK